jgi:hypothetical protein
MEARLFALDFTDAVQDCVVDGGDSAQLKVHTPELEAAIVKRWELLDCAHKGVSPSAQLASLEKVAAGSRLETCAMIHALLPLLHSSGSYSTSTSISTAAFHKLQAMAPPGH